MSYLQRCLARRATPIYFGNTIKYTIALVINRNASLAHSPHLPLPCGRLAPVRTAALCVCKYALALSPADPLENYVAAFCVQLIDALTDFAFVAVAGLDFDACEERNAPPAAWLTCLSSWLPPRLRLPAFQPAPACSCLSACSCSCLPFSPLLPC